MEIRKEKGLKLFKEGKIKKINKNQYEVQGTKKYFVKKVSEYWSCTCKDHFYRLEICKHVQGCQEYEKNKVKNIKKPNFFNNKLKNLKMKERGLKEQIKKVLKQNHEYMVKNGYKSDYLRKNHHRLSDKLLEVQNELKKFQPTRTVIIG